MGSKSLIGSRRGIYAAPLALALVCSGALVGCAGESESEEPAAPASAPPGRLSIGEFVLHLQPKLGRATIHRVQPVTVTPKPPAQGAPGLSPQVFSDINLQQDDVPNSGPASSVELVTDETTIYVNDVAHCGSAQSFCADVTLNSFWTRHLSNVFVEVTSIVDTNGNAITGHSSVNSDSPPSTCTPSSGCPSNALGLWRYTQSGADTGVVDTSGSATRQWRFANPDDADTYIKMRVVATLSYSSYTLSTSFRTVLNACTSGGTQVPTTTATRTATMPFSSAFYSLLSTTVKFNKHGYFVIGSTGITDTGGNVALPSPGVSKPAAFIFWDDLEYGGTASHMCFLTTGTAPARQFVMTWNDMNFQSPGSDKPAHLTFSAAIHEGSDEIDFYYQSMLGPTTRARGVGATVGAQDTTGTVAASGSTFNQALYSSNRSYTLVPIP